MWAALAVIVARVLAVIVLAMMNLTRLAQAQAWTVHTYDVVDEAHTMLLAMVSMETGMRGFVVAGKDAYLEPYDAGRKAFAAHWAKARTLTADNPKQQDRLLQMRARQPEFVAVAESLIAARREVDANEKTAEALASVFGAGRDKASMDAFRAL